MGLNTPLGGQHPIEGAAWLTLPVRVTAVAFSGADTHTVAYFGTATGHLKKAGCATFSIAPLFSNFLRTNSLAYKVHCQFNVIVLVINSDMKEHVAVTPSSFFNQSYFLM